MSDVVRWADAAQYRSAEMPEESKNVRGNVVPVVSLLNATPDPFGSLAAINGIYTGKVVRDLYSLSREDRISAFDNLQRTELSGPLESVQFHFLVEGVTRSFTHQMVRGRSAFYAQESLRFAVKENIDEEVAIPPSLAHLPQDHPWVTIWNRTINATDDGYSALVNAGMPAEEARDLLPHAVTTRLHWIIDLRGLLHVAGLRLCTQAQFQWRAVMLGVMKALREYGDYEWRSSEDGWQFHRIADSLRPVCYQQGRCGFMADFDRNCKIRDRVEAYARAGVPSAEWSKGKDAEGIPPINIAEWLMDPDAAREKPHEKS